MNVTFGLPTEALEKRFAAEAEDLGMGGLKGHRSVGGLRASIYNAMPLAGCEKLAEFMEAFIKCINNIDREIADAACAKTGSVAFT